MDVWIISVKLKRKRLIKYRKRNLMKLKLNTKTGTCAKEEGDRSYYTIIPKPGYVMYLRIQRSNHNLDVWRTEIRKNTMQLREKPLVYPRYPWTQTVINMAFTIINKWKKQHLYVELCFLLLHPSSLYPDYHPGPGAATVVSSFFCFVLSVCTLWLTLLAILDVTSRGDSEMRACFCVLKIRIFDNAATTKNDIISL